MTGRRIRADPEALALLGRQLRETSDDSRRALDRARARSAEVLTSVRNEVTRRTVQLEIAEAELAACLRDPDADCSAASAAVRSARASLDRAQRALRITRSACEGFSRSDGRLQPILTSLEADGLRMLTSKSSQLRAMGAVAVHGLGGGTGGGFSSHASSPSGGAAGGAASGSPQASPQSAPGLPAGFMLVPLSRIDLTRIQGLTQADFRKISVADCEWAFDVFDQVILPELAAGKNLNDFRDRDQSVGRQGTRSLADTHQGFLGGDAIKLDLLPNGQYKIGNGRHRIWVAARMGRTWVPARVA